MRCNKSRAAALAAVLAVSTVFALVPAVAQQTIPITSLRLYSNGLGWFQHSMTVEDNADLTLRIPVEHMADVLKSLTIRDLDGGTVEIAEYEAKDPLRMRLAKYAIDLSDNPSIYEMLLQIRGTAMEIQLVDGSVVVGTIVGAESLNGQDNPAQYVVLATATGIRRFPLSDVAAFRSLHPGVTSDMEAALRQLSEARDDRSRTITVTFAGEGRRRVSMSYVRQMPVWKSSYRLSIGDAGEANLQMWAQVENTTGSDWEDIQLSLFNGRPLSFRMDMYTPVYADRPELPYLTQENVAPPVSQPSIAMRSEPMAEMFSSAAPSPRARADRETADEAGGLGVTAGAAEVSRDTLIEYRIAQPVTIRRNRSAMVPILVDTVPVETVSVFNRTVVPDRPLRTVRFTNRREAALIAGPVTIVDQGDYAGDGRLDLVPAGEEALISYAVDSELIVDVDSSADPESIASARIVNGVLIESRLQRVQTTYRLNNRADESRVLLIEHPIRPGWDLAQPRDPDERTPDFYRFRQSLRSKQSAEVRVTEEQTRTTRIVLTNLNDERISVYLEQRFLSPALRRAFETIQELRNQLAQVQKERRDLENEESQIYRDQDRIRANMGELDRDSGLYRRYATTLGQQEDRLQNLRRELQRVREREATAEAALREYIGNLNAE